MQLVTLVYARLSKPALVLTKSVEWFGEPVGLDLIFESQQVGSVRLQLVEMPDEFDRRAGRKVVFNDQIDFDAFARNVHEQVFCNLERRSCSIPFARRRFATESASL